MRVCTRVRRQCRRLAGHASHVHVPPICTGLTACALVLLLPDQARSSLALSQLH